MCDYKENNHGTRQRLDRLIRFGICLSLIVFLSVQVVSAKTRWSSLKIIPDADLLSSGDLILEGYGVYFADSDGKANVNPGGVLRVGIMEWVNLHAGYAGGFTFGFKARILGETKRLMPSLAIGSHNILMHKEAYYFDADVSDDFNNEFYLAFGKTLSAIKTRLHFGIQTMPTVESEKINAFVGFEKYFGTGLYISLEGHMRKREFHPSLFFSWRLLKRKLELSAGVTELRKMLFTDNKFEISLSKPSQGRLVRPAIWFGIRFRGSLSAGKDGGFVSMGDKLSEQDEIIDRLSTEIENMKERAEKNKEEMERLQEDLTMVREGRKPKNEAMIATVFEKIMALKTIYEKHPFDPEKANDLMRELVNYKSGAIPGLKRLIADSEQERLVKVLAISVLGEIGDKNASDVLLDLIGRTEDPDVKIEILIALEKMKETRAVYIFEQMSNDPNEAVAFAAQEMLQKMIDETGVRPSSGFAPKVVSPPDSVSLEEKPISDDFGTPQETTAPAADTETP